MLVFVGLFMGCFEIHIIPRGESMRVNRVLFWALTYVLVIILCMSGTVITDRTVTAIAQSSPLDHRKTVVIDAGHGGEDGGAVSCSGVYESRINLEIALKLRDLMHLLGVKTVMTRTSDADLSRGGDTVSARKMSDLRERVSLVNSTDNAILLSIHQNKFPDDRYSGAQVFYADTFESKDLAELMQEGLIKNLDKTNKRHIKKANGIYLMDRINCTGILVECGFLSSPEEECLLKSDVYQKKLSCVIATVISRYLNT